MTKRMIIMLIVMGILFGGIFVYQLFSAKMMKKYMNPNMKPPVAVSTIKADISQWQSTLLATGSLRAIKGVDVTTELAGLVRTIEFTPGANVKKGELLVKLNDDTEVAQLNSLMAQKTLAQTTYERDKAQLAALAISQQTLDNDEANLKNLTAQVDQQKTIIAKKQISAPFAGKLGISYVNPGQYINPGDKIVTLQTLDPIYVDFYLPQQQLVSIVKGQDITLTTDTFPEKTFKGKITTISPKVEVATRNVQVEATLTNPKQQLLPGMFASVVITTGKPKEFITLPQTAISFNPYGEIVYIVSETGKDAKGKPMHIAKQSFVKVGDTRGDQIAVLKGISKGDVIVTSGQLKLKNGSQVIINNSIPVGNNPSPNLKNE